MSEKKIRVTLVRSPIGKSRRVRATLRGLGLTRMHKTMELENSNPVRGMVGKVSSMVRID